MVALGISLLGTKEIPGPKSNPTILKMAADLGLTKDMYSNDDEAWCALVQSWICVQSGKPLPFKGYDLLRARSFLKWGVPVPLGQEMLGDILVFKRPAGFHVGMYIAESKTTFATMGGNQRNEYSIVEISKNQDRFIEARRLYAIGPPASVKKYIVDSTGKLSTNEA